MAEYYAIGSLSNQEVYSNAFFNTKTSVINTLFFEPEQNLCKLFTQKIVAEKFIEYSGLNIDTIIIMKVSVLVSVFPKLMNIPNSKGRTSAYEYFEASKYEIDKVISYQHLSSLEEIVIPQSQIPEEKNKCCIIL